MRKPALVLLVSGLLAGAFLAGSWYSQRPGARNTNPDSRRVLYYMDPMHPAYKSDKPGIAPDCAMELVPVYEDGTGGPGGNPPGPPGTVQISPERQQLIGVRVSRVEKASATRTLRIFGRVAPDETRVYRLVAGIEGFIREVSPVTTGSQVEKNQWLATFSAPESRQPIQSYLVTLSVLDRVTQSDTETPAQVGAAEASTDLAVDRLLNLGMSRLQIEEIRRTRQVPSNIRILAPAAGFVLARDVSPGQKFERGAEWYRIADLSRVWIVAVVFENEARYVQPGRTVRVSLPHGGRSFRANVSAVLPQSDPATPTVKVRLEVDNPGYILRPDMFVDVELPVTLPPAITVPVDALLDAGLKKTVFVDRGNGFFEPRHVETGWRAGDRVEIVKGLMPGERILTSGTFLIDSESRMKAAAAGISGETSVDPICGMEVDQARAKAARRASEYQGKTYFFCSDGCKAQFDENPATHVKKAS